MAEKPILFNEEMYKAIIEGRKTQTRRVVKRNLWPFLKESEIVNGKVCLEMMDCDIIHLYQVGDHLWCKEPFRIMTFRKFCGNRVHGIYTRDDEMFMLDLTDKEIEKLRKWKEPYKGKSSLFMFKSLVRLWIEITAVRVERLQDITHSDIYHEGVILDENRDGEYTDILKQKWIELWDSVSKKERKWDQNPWVWVYEFKRIEK